ncbi:MAG: hypothetical protein M3065_01985 [Actinomycetota bacterium]|nr:hypothetical protein [Actinomycetota bacterium]
MSENTPGPDIIGGASNGTCAPPSKNEDRPQIPTERLIVASIDLPLRSPTLVITTRKDWLTTGVGGVTVILAPAAARTLLGSAKARTDSSVIAARANEAGLHSKTDTTRLRSLPS